MRIFLILLLFCQTVSVGQDYVQTQAVFDSIPEGYEVASPSIIPDSDAMVVGLYKDWEYKTPYFAEKDMNGKWQLGPFPMIDTIYNIATGNREFIYARKKKTPEGEISKVFVFGSNGGCLIREKEIKALENINAGYFNFVNETLYFFARKPKTGIYSVKMSDSNIESEPVWLSDALSLPDSDSFDVLMHPSEEKLLISQYYDVKKYPERGEPGIYYYEKIGGDWQRLKRLPLPYGWGPTITDDGWFIFAVASELRMVELSKLGIPW